MRRVVLQKGTVVQGLVPWEDVWREPFSIDYFGRVETRGVHDTRFVAGTVESYYIHQIRIYEENNA